MPVYNSQTASTPSMSTNVQILVFQAVPLVANKTNTATTATAVTGLTTGSIVLPAAVQTLEFNLDGDSVTNSGANSVIVTLWDGVVGSGTQIGQWTSNQTGDATPLSARFFVNVIPGSTHTYAIGMHGSGAGTNTMVASSTAPLNYTVKALN